MEKCEYMELPTLPSGERPLNYMSTDAAIQVSHCHTFKEEEPGVDRAAHRKLLVAVILCFFFVIGQAVGGILANSLAIATDAAHMLTDFFGYVINLVALHVSVRPSNKKLHFGWYRVQVLGALTSILLIWTVTVVLAYMAVLRIKAADFELDPKIMLLMAALGVVFNIIMLVSLNVDPHHSHSAPDTSAREDEHLLYDPRDLPEEDGHQKVRPATKPRNIGVLAAVIHVVGDLLQCVGVLIAAVMIYFKPEWKLADPVCTFLFCFIVLTTTLAVLRDIVIVLMEGAPGRVRYDDVKLSLMGIDGVQGVHGLRLWSLTLNKTASVVHLAVDNISDVHRVQEEAWKLLQQTYEVIECTVQVEEFTEDMLTCRLCKDPKD